jgi:hypothetical protein
MKGIHYLKTDVHDALLKLVIGHFSAHRRAQWEEEGVIEKLSELLVKRIYRRFDVKFKEVRSPNPYGDDDYAVPMK